MKKKLFRNIITFFEQPFPVKLIICYETLRTASEQDGLLGTT
jgi:hypothetical protein